MNHLKRSIESIERVWYYTNRNFLSSCSTRLLLIIKYTQGKSNEDYYKKIKRIFRDYLQVRRGILSRRSALPERVRRRPIDRFTVSIIIGHVTRFNHVKYAKRNLMCKQSRTSWNNRRAHLGIPRRQMREVYTEHMHAWHSLFTHSRLSCSRDVLFIGNQGKKGIFGVCARDVLETISKNWLEWNLFVPNRNF